MERESGGVRLRFFRWREIGNINWHSGATCNILNNNIRRDNI